MSGRAIFPIAQDDKSISRCRSIDDFNLVAARNYTLRRTTPKGLGRIALRQEYVDRALFLFAVELSRGVGPRGSAKARRSRIGRLWNGDYAAALEAWQANAAAGDPEAANNIGVLYNKAPRPRSR